MVVRLGVSFSILRKLCQKYCIEDFAKCYGTNKCIIRATCMPFKSDQFGIFCVFKASHSIFIVVIIIYALVLERECFSLSQPNTCFLWDLQSWPKPSENVLIDLSFELTLNLHWTFYDHVVWNGLIYIQAEEVYSFRMSWGCTQHWMVGVRG